MAQTQSVGNLFVELNRFGQSGEYERALKAANKILQSSHGNEKASHCKVVCFIQLGSFAEALAFLKKNPQLSSLLAFEKAYCEYRLNRTSDALQTLSEIEDKDNRTKELLGQVLYRLEQYEDCLDIYKSLIKNSDDDYNEERETNLAAVLAAMQAATSETLEDLNLSEDTYELCYNKACYLSAQGKYEQAEKLLEKAEAIFRKSIEDDPDCTEEDIETELGPNRVQLGYVRQKLGKPEAALKLYNIVLKQKQDMAQAAIAANNVIVINKDQNVFDSKKKIKLAAGDGLKHKLTSVQQKVIALNQCLLTYYMNQGEQCHHLSQQLRKKYPNTEMISLIEAAQYYKEKSVDKATQLLVDQLSAVSAPSVASKLTLAQLYLGQGKVYNACDVLKDMGELSHKPGMVSTLVILYLSQEDVEAAEGILEDSITWHKENNPGSDIYMMLMRASARFHMEHNQPQKATVILEELRKRDPRNLVILAQLIKAYSKFDAKKAQLVSRDLPSTDELAADVDIEGLETAATTFGPRYAKKVTKQEQSPVANGAAGENLDKIKRKKKRKVTLPKNYNPDIAPDPERWIARKERSTYKHKRKDKRRDIGKGTQGSASGDSSALDASARGGVAAGSLPTSVNSPGGAASSPLPGVGPRQQRPSKQVKKKKKGGKW